MTKVSRNGSAKDLLREPTGVDGVASNRRGVAYTTTDFAPATRSALVKFRSNGGTVRTVADLWPYEQKNNPDAGNTYGFLDLTPGVPPRWTRSRRHRRTKGRRSAGVRTRGPRTRTRTPSPNDGRGGWYVADAGMNAIMHVSKRGAISTVAVLPPQPAEVTAAGATALGTPKCTVGSTYAFEPVPTDVEVGHRGKLIVSTLPGAHKSKARRSGRGPRPDARHPHVGPAHDGGATVSDPIVSGLLAPLQIDLGHHGKIYVAQSFSGVLTRSTGTARTEDLTSEPAGIDGVASGPPRRRLHDHRLRAGHPRGAAEAPQERRDGQDGRRPVALREERTTPTQANTYGFLDLTDEVRRRGGRPPAAPGGRGPAAER